ncbi:MAG: UvrD-helicase domain-containing protein [Clostridia bacterium]|nr:UvrD-helicase domain-containing protein [Clostridia bacterium]
MRNYEFLTESQRKAVFHDSGNVIISASAGSGKTHVVIERIIRLITQKNVPLEKVLAVTFTNAAASEMKEKLKKALTEEYNESGDIRFKRELEKVAIADVSTIHSFCANLLKKYFYALGLDASFAVLDAKKSKKLQSKAMANLFERLYVEQNENFLKLVDVFGGKRKDRGLREIIHKIYSFSSSELGLMELKQKTINSHQNVIKIIDGKILSYFKEEALEYVDVFKALKSNFIGDEKRQGACQTLCDIASELANATSLFDFAKKYSEFEIRLPQTKCENSELLEEFKYYAGEFKNTYTYIFETFSGNKKALEESVLNNVETVNELFNLTFLYEEEYSSLKSEENGVDFLDLEKCTLKLFENEEILKEISNNYDYIFVDEYQDVNALQEQIITKISRNNAFLVGDSKQSIYAFRGCNPKYFIEKYNKYLKGEGGIAISLDANFRSAKKIIDLTNNVFSDVFIDKFSGQNYKENQMIYGGSYKTFDGETAIHLIEDVKKEEAKPESKVYSVMENYSLGVKKEYSKQVVLTIKLITDLLKTEYYDIKEADENKRLKQVEYKDICILVRGVNGYGEELVSALYDVGIPVTSSATVSVAKYAEIKALIDVLNAVLMPRRDIPFASTLINFGNFTEQELVAIKMANAKEKSFYNCVINYANLGNNLAKKLSEFVTWFSSVRLISEYASASEVLYKIIGDTGYDAKILSMPFGEERLKRVERFIAESVSSEKSMSVGEFIEYLEDSLEEITQSQTAGENTVQVMTEHASKGLEFPVVIVADFEKLFNSRDITGDVLFSKEYGIVPKNYNLDNMTYSENVLRQVVKLEYKRERAVEEARLFYVAITRAKYAVHFIANTSTLYNKRLYSNFKMADRQACYLKDGDAPITLHLDSELKLNCVENGTPVVGNKIDKNLASSIKDNLLFEYPYKQDTLLPLKSSVSEVNKGDDLEYYETTNIFGYSSSETGTAYHRFLELCNYYGESAVEQKNQMLKDGLITKEQASLLQDGNLQAILNLDIFNTIKDYKFIKEQKFCCLFDASELGYFNSSEQILVQGIIDLLAVKGNSAILIDFKYSTIKNDEDLIKNYYTQLKLYKQAIEKSSNYKISEVYLVNILQLRSIKVEI